MCYIVACLYSLILFIISAKFRLYIMLFRCTKMPLKYLGQTKITLISRNILPVKIIFLCTCRIGRVMVLLLKIDNMLVQIKSLMAVL